MSDDEVVEILNDVPDVPTAVVNGPVYPAATDAVSVPEFVTGEFVTVYPVGRERPTEVTYASDVEAEDNKN